MRYPSFVDGSNESASIIASVERTVNMMPEIVGPTGKNTTVLVGTPGLSLLKDVDVSGESIRGLFEGDLTEVDYFYCVVDDTLYKVATDGSTAEEIGTLDQESSESPSVSPSESPSISPSVSESPSESPSMSPSSSESPSESPSLSASASISPSSSESPSESPSASPSASESPSESPSLSPSASNSPSESPSVSPSESPSVSPSNSASESPSESPSLSPSDEPTSSESASLSPSASESPSLSPSASESPSESPSASPSDREASESMPIRFVTGDTTADTLIISNGVAFQLVSGQLSVIIDLAGKTCLDCTYLGGYFIVITDEFLFYRSDLGDISTWDMTNYDFPDTQPEPLVGVINSQNQLWFFGKTRTSVWTLDSTNTLGMSRINGISIRYGLWSNATLKILDNGIVWLAALQDGVGRICLSRNYAPEKISTHYVDTTITENTSSLTTSYSIVMDNNGHEIYQLSMPGAETSLCYDASTQRWHERGYWTGSSYYIHLAKCSMSKDGTQYVGARNSGKIYTISMDTYTDEDDDIRRLRRAPHIHVEDKDLTYDKFQLDLEKGLGSQGTNPKMYMRYSNNGGKTYSTAIDSAMGEATDDINTIRVEWNRLGTGRDYVFEVYTTATQRHCWIDAYIN